MGINSSPFFLGFYLMPITAIVLFLKYEIRTSLFNYIYIWNICKYVYISYIFIHTVYDLDTYGGLMINSCTILGTDTFSTHAVTYKRPPQATRNGLNYNDRSMRWPCMESNILWPDICSCYPLERVECSFRDCCQRTFHSYPFDGSDEDLSLRTINQAAMTGLFVT